MQTNGLHFFNKKPDPSGQQYTGISVAEAAMKLIPKDEINNKTTLNKEVEKSLDLMAELPAEGSCGDAPAPLNTSLPNVLMIGDSISMPGSGCERSQPSQTSINLLSSLIPTSNICTDACPSRVKPLLLRADGPGVEEILMQPGVQHKDLTRGPLAAVQHNGGKGSNQAGPTPN
eukprot:COSAG04_NODE_12347_length_657_cov_0.865591_1_plen_173_part_01